ncbi:MAG: hypothetical protein WDM76_00360 [Limisphaerales bacterium]
MKDKKNIFDYFEVFLGTLGLGLVFFGLAGLARGNRGLEKLVFIPIGFVLAGPCLLATTKTPTKVTSQISHLPIEQGK